MDIIRKQIEGSNNEREKKRIPSVLERIDKFESEGELIKKEYTDLNSDFNRIVEAFFNRGAGMRGTLLRLRQESPSTVKDNMVWDTPSNGTGLKKYIRTAKKYDLSGECDQMKELVKLSIDGSEELLLYKERISALKDTIVKKRKDVVAKEEDKAKTANHEDVKTAKVHLDGIIESLHSKVVASNKESLLGRYRMIMHALIKDDLKRDKKHYRRNEEVKTHQKEYPLSEILQVANMCNKNENFIIKDKKEIEKIAETEAEKIFQQLKAFYITRISEKVGIVLRHKGNLDSIKTISLEASNEIEAYLKFNFKDNSSFELSTKVEWSTLPSDYTISFMRVPTRFHNAVTPDGKKHTQLSEKIIQDIFVYDAAENSSKIKSNRIVKP